MEKDQFESWLRKLSKTDMEYLERQPGWKESHERARKGGRLPEGFVERTMELLEGGSESET